MSSFLELELEIEPSSSPSTANAPNHWAASPAPCCFFAAPWLYFLLLVRNQPGPNGVCYFRYEVVKVCRVVQNYKYFPKIYTKMCQRTSTLKRGPISSQYVHLYLDGKHSENLKCLYYSEARNAIFFKPTSQLSNLLLRNKYLGHQPQPLLGFYSSFQPGL